MKVVLTLGLLSLLSLTQGLPNFGPHAPAVENRVWSLEKVDLETTVIACASNNQFADRLRVAFDNCRQYDKNPKGKGKGKGKARRLLNRQGKKGMKKGKKGKKGKKSKKSKKGKGKGSMRCISVNQLMEKIKARSRSIIFTYY